MSDSLYSASTGIGKMLGMLESIFGELSSAELMLKSFGWSVPPALTTIGLETIQFSVFLEKLKVVLDSTDEETSDTSVMAPRLVELSIELKNLVQSIYQLCDDLPAQLSGFGDYAEKTGIATEFPKRLFNFWVSTAVSSYSLPLFSLLRLIDVIEYHHFEADETIFQTEHIRPLIHYDAFTSFLSDPPGHLKKVYGWGTLEFADQELLLRISMLFESLGLNARTKSLDLRAENVFTNQVIPADAMP